MKPRGRKDTVSATGFPRFHWHASDLGRNSEYANYWLRNPMTGKQRKSRWKMAREDALALDPDATP